MKQIPDDPIIRCMERTGYPPWWKDDDEWWEDDEFFDNEDDIFYGNDTIDY